MEYNFKLPDCRTSGQSCGVGELPVCVSSREAGQALIFVVATGASVGAFKFKFYSASLRTLVFEE